MEKVSEEIAQKEFDDWFEARKLPGTRRKGDAESIVKEMVCAISEGYIVINEDLGVDLILREPLKNAISLSKLTFKNRITAGELQAKMGQLKADDSNGRQIAVIAALTDEVGGNIRALGSIDYSICTVISAFY